MCQKLLNHTYYFNGQKAMNSGNKQKRQGATAGWGGGHPHVRPVLPHGSRTSPSGCPSLLGDTGAHVSWLPSQETLHPSSLSLHPQKFPLSTPRSMTRAVNLVLMECTFSSEEIIDVMESLDAESYRLANAEGTHYRHTTNKS